MMRKGKIEFNDPTFREHPQKGLKPLTIDEKREQVRKGGGIVLIGGGSYGGDSNQLIADLIADRDKWRDRCERLVSWYGHPQEWRCNVSRYNYGHECSLDECVKREYNSGSHGFSFAQQIQKEIDDDAI